MAERRQRVKYELKTLEGKFDVTLTILYDFPGGQGYVCAPSSCRTAPGWHQAQRRRDWLPPLGFENNIILVLQAQGTPVTDYKLVGLVEPGR
jgi:hypothetical protein